MDQRKTCEPEASSIIIQHLTEKCRDMQGVHCDNVKAILPFVYEKMGNFEGEFPLPALDAEL